MERRGSAVFQLTKASHGARNQRDASRDKAATSSGSTAGVLPEGGRNPTRCSKGLVRRLRTVRAGALELRSRMAQELSFCLPQQLVHGDVHVTAHQLVPRTAEALGVRVRRADDLLPIAAPTVPVRGLLPLSEMLHARGVGCEGGAPRIAGVGMMAVSSHWHWLVGTTGTAGEGCWVSTAPRVWASRESASGEYAPRARLV